MKAENPTMTAVAVASLLDLYPATDAILGVSSGVELLTPEDALALLDANPLNRHVSQPSVDKCARDMAAGDWQLNGETIKIDTSEYLIDGQHRCLAVIQSETPIWTVIVRGLDPLVRATVDAGRKRTLADQLYMEGMNNSGILQSLSRRMLRWDAGFYMSGGGTLQPTSTEMRRWIDTNPTCQKWAGYGASNQQKVGVSAGTLALAGMLLERINVPEQCAEFTARLSDGAGLALGHPVLVLRARLVREHQLVRGIGITKQDDQLASIISVWNAYRKGRVLSHVQMPKGGLSNATFPMPR